jgi:hypothetical protein
MKSVDRVKKRFSSCDIFSAERGKMKKKMNSKPKYLNGNSWFHSGAYSQDFLKSVFSKVSEKPFLKNVLRLPIL